MNFFTKNPNQKKKNFFFVVVFFWGGGGRRGVRGSGRGRWMDRQTGPNQFAPFNFFKVGGTTMH